MLDFKEILRSYIKMSGQLCLKWNNHSVAILKNVSNIQIREKYCDATIVCQEKYFPVHRIILSTCSEYFDEIFERMQCQHPYIVFKDIESREMELLLNYMYQGEVNVLQDMLPTLIKAAEALRIRGLAVSDEIFSSKETSLAKKQSNYSRDFHSHKIGESTRRRNLLGLNLPSKVNESHNCSNAVLESKAAQKRLNPSCNELNDVQSEAMKEEPLDISECTDTTEHNGGDEIFNDDPTSLLSQSISNSKKSFSTYSICEEPSAIIKDEVVVHPEETFDVQTCWNDFSDGGDAVQSLSSIEINTQDGISEEKAPAVSQHNTHLFINSPNRRKDRDGVNLLSHIFASRKSTDFQQCPYCNYEGLAHNVKRHIKYRHTRERPFMCCLCPARFTEKVTLKRHMRIHTGERPFQCPNCPKKFSSKFNLKSHIERKHGPT